MSEQTTVADSRVSRRQAKSRSKRLTRDQVLSAALQIVDTHGIDDLSMRRLATQLGCDPMSIYRHAASKSDLLDGIADLVRDRVQIDPNADDWRAQLRSMAYQFRAAGMQHPRVVPLIVSRPIGVPLGLQSPGTLRLLDQVLALLHRHGFSPENALHAYRTLLAFLRGHILSEARERAADPAETEPLLQLRLHRMGDGEGQHIRQVSAELAHYDGDVEFELGLAAVLHGLDVFKQ